MYSSHFWMKIARDLIIFKTISKFRWSDLRRTTNLLKGMRGKSFSQNEGEVIRRTIQRNKGTFKIQQTSDANVPKNVNTRLFFYNILIYSIRMFKMILMGKKLRIT